ncbi:biotin-dependent carboxyltransferase family protein [Bradyrhizobium sp. JYMT SZCCT0180]|uniref:5-oxoprolinase subunit C family protein n=1 Tax=Bradyrhizobium sp. JYMT SZCCT0180 TaxID=2807666 RepID=UPI001BAB3270|nr:biotin-dependent carboxyltransferase family protein [Bradyrhizobium sp. JYMT SZCCT0180]MBR1212024.1 biotin-dependent carboxyltransferase [Bradyrhizobium sp. JYMT SZCCT0180]
MSKLVITSIGPASSVQDGGRPGSQRYGLVPSGAMDRLALAAANTLVGNELFAAAVEIGPFGAAFTARGGAVRIALSGASRNADIAGRPVAIDTSATLADGETLTLGFARSGSFSYLAIEGGIAGEPDFGSLAVNARAGLGSPYPRPLQSGDELQTKPASGAPERRIEQPATAEAPIRIVWGPQDDEFGDDAKKLFIDSEWKISATSDRMGYRLEGSVIKHLHGHNIVSDGTVNGSLQVPGNGQPIVLMPDRGTTGGYPKIATVISADFGRFAQTSAGRVFRFKAVSMAEAQAAARRFWELLRSLPDRLRSIESFDLNIDALQDANVAGYAVSAVDATTWQVASPADVSGPD